MTILALDPGTAMTAYVRMSHDGTIEAHGKLPNEQMIAVVDGHPYMQPVVCEMIASYGMSVGSEVFDTCVWIGRFWERHAGSWDARTFHRLYRKDIKSHLCHSMKANDAAIRCALIDRYGPGKDKAIGTKKNPGPLYGIKADVWAALAVAVTWKDTHP
jgi:hypothetical protein